jgi:hypothetical protein
MTAERILPEDPLEFIRRCAQQRKLFWTYHVNMRLRGRFIDRKAILESTANYEILKSIRWINIFQVTSFTRSMVVIFSMFFFAVDVEGDNVRIVTAYHPGSEEWEAEAKTRRQQS